MAFKQSATARHTKKKDNYEKTGSKSGIITGPLNLCILSTYKS